MTYKMIANVDCPNCADAKSLLAKQIEQGIISIIDENHPDYQTYTDVELVPTFLKGQSMCELTVDDDNVYRFECDDGSSEVIQSIKESIVPTKSDGDLT